MASSSGLPRDARRLSAADQEALRMRGMGMLSAGSSQAEAAKLLGVSRQAVHQWARVSREGGPGALRSRRRGRPRARPLEPWQEEQVLRAIVLFPPAELGLRCRCWTRAAIAQIVERWFGVSLSLWLVGSYLARWGFASHQSARYLFERTHPRLLPWLRDSSIRAGAAAKPSAGLEIGAQSA